MSSIFLIASGKALPSSSSRRVKAHGSRRSRGFEAEGTVVQWRSATAVVESGRDIFARADQTAPLSLQDVLQVTVLPLMQTLQTSTHWLNFFGSKFVYCRAMQTRCSS